MNLIKPTLSPDDEKALDHLTKNEATFLDLAKSTYEAREHFATRFREMVSFASSSALEPKRITLLLRASGFVDSRISEFKTIALDPEACKRYTTGQIGFKPALEEARTKKATKSAKAQKSTKQKKLATKATQTLIEYVTHVPTLKSFTWQLPGFVCLVIRTDDEKFDSQPFRDNKGNALKAHVKISASLPGQK